MAWSQGLLQEFVLIREGHLYLQSWNSPMQSDIDIYFKTTRIVYSTRKDLMDRKIQLGDKKERAQN